MWYLDSLPELVSEAVSNVSSIHVWCHFFNRGGGAERSLTSQFGEIVDSVASNRHPCYSMRAVVGTVRTVLSTTDEHDLQRNSIITPRLTRWAAGEIVFARADS